MEPRIPIAAITDEFSPDLEPALDVMEEIGMRAVELRVVNGKNILDLTDDELTQVAALLASRGFRSISIASPHDARCSCISRSVRHDVLAD